MPNRVPDDYVSVQKRLELFWSKTGDEAGHVETEIDWRDTGHALVRAKVTDHRGSVGIGHAFTTLKDEKQLEKAETAAVGRALAHLGYPTTERQVRDVGPTSPSDALAGAESSEVWA